MSHDTATEPDRIEGAPHPRETKHLFGQRAAEEAFLQAFHSDRLHHGWLINGPRGVGKATLAWRIARFLLANPADAGDGLFCETLPKAESLDVTVDHPVARRILSGSEPGLFHIRRSLNDKTGRLRDQIIAEDVRALNGFFGLTAADGGRRIVIIDAADEMNVQAANALLKMLEEPPERATLLLVSHQPARLLPTIRSRCRELRLSPLAPEQMQAALSQAGIESGGRSDALAELAAGSVGEAVRLHNQNGLQLYADLVRLGAELPKLDRSRAIKLAEAMSARDASERLDLLFALIDLFLVRLARAGALGHAPPEAAENEAAVLCRLSPGPRQARAWADCAELVGSRSRHGRAVNLDPTALVLDTVFKLQQTAASL
ncbi:MAG: DNA polymerase III subunit delta' [Pseudomonadota bacterium]